MGRYFYKGLAFSFEIAKSNPGVISWEASIKNHKGLLIDEVSVPDILSDRVEQIDYIIKVIDKWTSPLKYYQFRMLRDKCELIYKHSKLESNSREYEDFKFAINRNLSRDEIFHLYQFLKCYGIELWNWEDYNSVLVLREDWEKKINALEKVVLFGEDVEPLFFL